MEDVDGASLPQAPQDQLVKQHSLPALVAGGGKGGSERERQLLEEISKLRPRISILAKVVHTYTLHTRTHTHTHTHSNLLVSKPHHL